MELPVKIKGTVIHGNHIGNTIGMPTANIGLPESLREMPFGVYYSTVHVDGKIYRGITNIGKKPTVQDSGSVNAETFIYDFDGDLYGKEITVELIEFRRPEMKFESFAELSETMHRDMEAGRNHQKQ